MKFNCNLQYKKYRKKIMSDYETYESPLSRRYASEEMKHLFSEKHKIITWRKLWIALAKAQREAGLDIVKKEQIDEMKKQLENIDFDFVREKEREIKHDVMAHIHAFGKVAPKAAGIIHLGATSCFVLDNADLIIFRDALVLLHKRLLFIINSLKEFASKYREHATLGYTHFQPAQPTTVGKRACLWLFDFLTAAKDIERVIKELKFRSIKGTTGTQASFMILFEDEEKVKKVEKKVAEICGFKNIYPVTGQTYPLIVDVQILTCLLLISSAAGKFSEDLRLLAHENELDEPFGKMQVGSSAMPYKRNPVKAERVSSLSRFLKNLSQNVVDNQQHQWLERTLDDSANRRLTMSEAFLTAEAILLLCAEISSGIIVNEEMIKKNLFDYVPFLITEELLMRATLKDGDRQVLHEKIRKHSQAALKKVKEKGYNDLLDRLKKDRAFADFREILDRKEIFTGRASSQVDEFLKAEVIPYLRKYDTDNEIPETSV